VAEYTGSSPYFSTGQSNGVLGILIYRDFAFELDDILYQIDAIYNLRPDLFAFDQYGDPNLWWVFMHRNPNILKDAIWSFRTGTQIRVPKLSTLKRDLGI